MAGVEEVENVPLPWLEQSRSSELCPSARKSAVRRDDGRAEPALLEVDAPAIEQLGCSVESIGWGFGSANALGRGADSAIARSVESIGWGVGSTAVFEQCAGLACAITWT